MADGFSRPRLEPGVYLDLPLADYLADPGVSGSGLKLLLTDPPAWRWERPDNPLREVPESRPQRRGAAAHCAILEGLAAYERRYAVAPRRADHPDALETVEDLKNWLRDRGLKLTGAKADLIDRVLSETNGAHVWDRIVEDALAGRVALSEAEDAYVRLLEGFVRADPAFAPLVTGGLAELSVIWEETGVRFKARLDYVSRAGICELKTFGQSPRRGRSLRTHVVTELVNHSYDLQAYHNVRALQRARARYDELPIHASGPNATARIAAAVDLLSGSDENERLTWLFLRMGSAPSGIALPFRPGSELWRRAEDDAETALDHYRRFRDAYGDGLWLQSEGLCEIEDGDVPPWAWELPR